MANFAAYDGSSRVVLAVEQTNAELTNHAQKYDLRRGFDGKRQDKRIGEMRDADASMVLEFIGQ
jgi:hypothetical protein